MTTTINADNVTGGAVVTADASGELALQAAGVTKLTVNSSGVTLASALPVASGGTGTTSTTFANLTTNVTGTLPIANGGTGTTSTTFVNAATNVTGTLPITNGGTGASTLAGANIAVTNAVNSFAGAQIGSVTALTSSGSSIAINLATNNNFSYTTVENSTLAAPSNPVAGQSGAITITQGATPRTLAYNSFYKFAGGTIPALSTTAGAVDLLVYYVESSSRATCQLIKDAK